MLLGVVLRYAMEVVMHVLRQGLFKLKLVLRGRVRCVRIPGLLVFLHRKGVLSHPLQASSMPEGFQDSCFSGQEDFIGFLSDCLLHWNWVTQ